MKVSRNWLQTYFDTPLPPVAELADAFTFHAFEVEAIAGEMLDLKVLPDRAGYALSHRGIAYELSAILNIPLKHDPLREALPEWPATEKLEISEDPEYVVRHTGALYRGVTVGPSPEWLKDALESVGQKSINNIVDASNYVMLNIGQPSGVFDLGVLKISGDTHRIDIRRAREGELSMTVLTGESITLSKNIFVFGDAVSGVLLDIAGVKGSLKSGVTESTTDLFISCGNYNGTLIRRMAQGLKLFTDASQRFQNRPSPELTAYGMRDLLALIKKVAGGELVGVVDIFPNRTHPPKVSVTISEIRELLGSDPGEQDIADALHRLRLPYERDGETFMVTPTFERTDLTIKEDFIEEVGRIVGYENLDAIEFPDVPDAAEQKRYRGIERIKDFLVERGFIEISTQSFAKKGDIGLANPLDAQNPFLRSSLSANMDAAMKQAKYHAPLVLEPNTPIRLFEIGSVFQKGGEKLFLALSEPVPELNELGLSGTDREHDLSEINLNKLGENFVPKRYSLGPFKPFSVYPFVLRDIAVLVHEGTNSTTIYDSIRKNAGELLYRCDLFDEFKKDGKVSYAFRLVFQSMDRTLSDGEVNSIVKSITDDLNAKEGWKVR